MFLTIAIIINVIVSNQITQFKYEIRSLKVVHLHLSYTYMSSISYILLIRICVIVMILYELLLFLNVNL